MHYLIFQSWCSKSHMCKVSKSESSVLCSQLLFNYAALHMECLMDVLDHMLQNDYKIYDSVSLSTIFCLYL